MKKIIITTLIATAFISLLLSANVKPQERKQQPVPIITTTYMTEKEKIAAEHATPPPTTTSATTITLEQKRIILSHLIDCIEIGRDYTITVKMNASYEQFCGWGNR